MTSGSPRGSASPGQEIEARIPNRLDELAKIVLVVDSFGAAHRIPAAIVNDLNLALDEVLNNIVSYGYPNADNAEITVRLRHEAGRVRVEIEDDGIAFNPLAPRRRETAARRPRRRVGGLGIRFIRGLMDEVAYERIDGRNRLRLTRRIPEVS